jgi:hypothetical protein
MNTVGTTLWATVHTGGTAALPNDYFTYWSSIDGVTWVVEGEAVNGQADVLEQELFVEPIPTRAGLIRHFGYDFQRSADGGVTWTAIPGPPVECSGPMGGPSIVLVGDFLYCGGYDGFWVGHFDA